MAPNLFYTSTGEVVYYMAAVGIVYNQTRHSQRHFVQHTDDILCLGIHPNRSTVASGQASKTGVVIVWDTADMKMLAKLVCG
jgi:WD40 repeat protein